MDSSNPLRVLIIEDSVDDTFFTVRELQRGGYQVEFERVENALAMEAALDRGGWDLIISDFSMPQFGGAAALALYLESGLDIPFILVSGVIGEDVAVEMLKAGAHDYIKKDNLRRLVPAVRRELQAARERLVRQQTEKTTSFLASLVQSCEDAIIGVTLDCTVVSWNPAAEKLLGYSAVEMIGRSMSALWPEYRPAEVPEALERIKAGERVPRFETVRVRKDGQRVEVSLTLSPVKDSEGRVVGASMVVRDITQRKQEEGERLALIQELTAALSHAH